MRLKRHVLTRKLRKCQAEKGQITPVGINSIQDDQLFDQKASILVPIMFLTQNFKKIGGSNCKNFKKLNTGILITLRHFCDSNWGILKIVEPDSLTLGFV